MKNSRLKGFLVLLASSFLFVHCTSDLEIPDPIPGPAGQDGVDGIDGLDGLDGTASCVSCHNDVTRDAIAASFSLSAHATGGTFARGERASCAQCHGNEGYIDYITTGAVKPYTLELAYALGDSIVYDTINPYPNVSPFSCATCHDTHRTFDFENDGSDFALRNTDPVTLVIDETTVIDFMGSSNSCITCHQPRNSYVIPAENGTGKYVITSTRFGPHHGPQSTVLEGIMGANLPGSEGYPGVGTAAHRTGSSCVACHMGPSTTMEDGMHSWIPTVESCVACHPNGAPDEIAGFTNEFETLEQLLAQVVGEEYEEDAEGNPVFDTDGNPVGNGTPVVGIIVNGRSQTGIYTTAEAQAAWNYMTAREDQSKGIHNPAYIRALLRNSIEALQN